MSLEEILFTALSYQPEIPAHLAHIANQLTDTASAPSQLILKNLAERKKAMTDPSYQPKFEPLPDELMEYLHKNIRKFNPNDRALLERAVIYDNVRVVLLALLSTDFNIDISKRITRLSEDENYIEDITPLLVIAAGHRCEAMMALLILAGTNIHATNESGWTALHGAAFGGFIDLVRELIKRGANVNRQESYGETPLHHATASNYTRIVQCLIASGADASLCTTQGRTPLAFAQYRKVVVHKETLDWLTWPDRFETFKKNLNHQPAQHITLIANTVTQYLQYPTTEKHIRFGAWDKDVQVLIKSLKPLTTFNLHDFFYCENGAMAIFSQSMALAYNNYVKDYQEINSLRPAYIDSTLMAGFNQHGFNVLTQLLKAIINDPKAENILSQFQSNVIDHYAELYKIQSLVAAQTNVAFNMGFLSTDSAGKYAYALHTVRLYQAAKDFYSNNNTVLQQIDAQIELMEKMAAKLAPTSSPQLKSAATSVVQPQPSTLVDFNRQKQAQRITNVETAKDHAQSTEEVSTEAVKKSPQLKLKVTPFN